MLLCSRAVRGRYEHWQARRPPLEGHAGPVIEGSGARKARRRRFAGRLVAFLANRTWRASGQGGLSLSAGWPAGPAADRPPRSAPLGSSAGPLQGPNVPVCPAERSAGDLLQGGHQPDEDDRLYLSGQFGKRHCPPAFPGSVRGISRGEGTGHGLRLYEIV